MSDLTTAVIEILDRRDEYEAAEEYYEGTAEEVFTSLAIKRALKKTGERFRLNFAATPVNAVNNRLEITSVTPAASGHESAAGEYLDRVWASNELELEVSQVHKNALIYGDAYLVVWPEGDSLEVYYNSPKTTVVLYEEENPRRKRCAAKMWSVTVEGKDRTRVNLYYADRVEKYISAGERLPHTPKDSDFVPYVDGHTDGNGIMPHSLGRIPVFHFRTERPLGKPEHKNAYEPQDMINKLAVTQMAANDFHGFPQRYALSAEGSSEAADFDEDSETVVASNTPGEMSIFNNIREVGQFKAADPSTFLDPLRVYIRAMATITETPLHYFEPTGNVPSGEALRVAEAPLVKKVRTRQLSFGATWREVFVFFLESAGFMEDVQVHWKPVETFDTKEAMEIARIKRQIGIPLPQVAAELGYDTAIVAKWPVEEYNPSIQAGSDIPGDSEKKDLNPDAKATQAVPDGSKAKAA